MKPLACLLLSVALLAPLLASARKGDKNDKQDRQAQAQKEAPATQPQKKRPDKNKNAGNLVVNGDLEKGSGRTPKGWAPFDGITQLWDDKGYPHKCLLVDTSVLQKDKKRFIECEEEYRKHGKSKGGQYDVVGAHEGAWGYPPPIDLKPDDDWFILSADVWTHASSSELFFPQILVRGFTEVTEVHDDDAAVWFHEYYKDGHGYEDVFGSKDLIRKPRIGDWRQVYRHAMACRCSVAKQWRHFELGFHLPKMKKFRPTRLLLKCYAIWPAGEYRFDNISLRRATKAEADEANARRPSIREVVPE